MFGVAYALVAPDSAKYQLSLNGEGAVRVWLDGKKIIEDLQPSTSARNGFNLTADPQRRRPTSKGQALRSESRVFPTGVDAPA
jgi:hypothetical protein